MKKYYRLVLVTFSAACDGRKFERVFNWKTGEWQDKLTAECETDDERLVRLEIAAFAVDGFPLNFVSLHLELI